MTGAQRQKLKAMAWKAFEDQAERTAWSMVRWLALETNTIESRAVKGVELMVAEGFLEKTEKEGSLYFRLGHRLLHDKAVAEFYQKSKFD